MKKLILALILSLSVSSCDQQNAADGYYFEKGSQRIHRQIETVLYPDQATLLAAYESETGKKRQLGNEELFGFSAINDTTCTINIIDPKVRYKPEEYGHELTHCLYGEFHPSQNDR
jgi:hypothetical protein